MAFSISSYHISQVRADIRIRFELGLTSKMPEIIPLRGRGRPAFLMRVSVSKLPMDENRARTLLVGRWITALRKAARLGFRRPACAILVRGIDVDEHLLYMAMLEAALACPETEMMQITLCFPRPFPEMRFCTQDGETEPFVRYARMYEERRQEEDTLRSVYEQFSLNGDLNAFMPGTLSGDTTGKGVNPPLSFRGRLFELIDERKMKDADVYRIANLDRKLFSKIRCKPGYRPRKRTILALAVALELTFEETTDLLSRAGHAFSPSDPYDLILIWYIRREQYDIFTINMTLFNHNLPPLGSR